LAVLLSILIHALSPFPSADKVVENDDDDDELS
jgi:hypothetical protein